MKDLKILSLPVDKGGCGQYRIRQPFEMIQINTMSDAHVIDRETDNMIEVAEAMCVANIIVVRQGAEAGMQLFHDVIQKYGEEIGQPKSITGKWVIDIDDNVEMISPYSEHYGEYGTQEFFDENSKKWLWKNGQIAGERAFNVYENRAKLMNLITGMVEADLITVTTERLAEYARKFNKNVKVLPNSIDFSKWWSLETKPNDQLRIGWSGGMSHYEDWYSIKEPLNRLLRKYKFKLIMVGQSFPGLIDEDLRYLVESHPWVDFSAHSYRMMCMKLDIAIIPLADLPFNYFKSPIKLCEMSAMAVPSLVAAVPPYSDVVEDRNNALLYKDENEFEQNLEFLITHNKFREEMGKRAQQWVKEEYNAAKLAQRYIDVYRSIL